MTAELLAAIGSTEAVEAVLCRLRNSLGAAWHVHYENGAGQAVIGFVPVAEVEGSNLAVDQRTGVAVLYDGWLSEVEGLTSRLGVTHNTSLLGGDADLLLHAYLAWGDTVVDYLNGQFCLVVADPRFDGLFIATDSFATRPLYVRSIHGSHFVGSSARSLARISPTASLCCEAFLEMLYRQVIRAPKTIFQEVSAVEAGTTRWICKTPQSPRNRRRWCFQPVAMTGDAALDLLDGTLADVLSRAEHRDAPHFVALSGGIDSSLVATYLHRGGGRLTPTTVAVDWSDGIMDETERARTVAGALGRQLRVIEISTETFPDFLRAHVRAMDQPCPLGLGISLLAQSLRKGETLGLSGLGADEFFSGYPELGQHLVGRGSGDLVDTYLKISGLFPYRVVEAVGEAIGTPFAPVHEYIRSRMLDDLDGASGAAATASLLIHNFLVPGDIYSYRLFTAVRGIRIRHPFLDRRLVDAASRIPLSLTVGNKPSVGKPLLRRLARHAGLPRNIWTAPKHGFAVPASELIERSATRCGWFLEPDSTQEFVQVLLNARLFEMPTDLTRNQVTAYRWWARLLFAAWLDEYFSGGVGSSL